MLPSEHVREHVREKLRLLPLCYPTFEGPRMKLTKGNIAALKLPPGKNDYTDLGR